MKQGAETSMKTKRRLPYKELVGTFRNFHDSERTNIMEWLDDFDVMCEMAGWNEDEKAINLLKSVDGEAKDVALRRGRRGYESMKRYLLDEYAWSWEPHMAMRRFLSRRLMSGETVTRYMLDMETMGRAAKMDEETIRSLIVDGTGFNEGISFFLSQRKSFHELRIGIEYAREELRRESRRKQTDMLLKEENCQFMGTKRAYTEDDDEIDQAIPRTTRCVNCGGGDHQIDDCPHKNRGRKCFNCDQFGHISANCNMKKRNKNRNDEWTNRNGNEVMAERYPKELQTSAEMQRDYEAALGDHGSDVDEIKPSGGEAIIGRVTKDEKLKSEVHDRVPVRVNNTEPKATQTAEEHDKNGKEYKEEPLGVIELVGNVIENGKRTEQTTITDYEDENNECSAVIEPLNEMRWRRIKSVVDELECFGRKEESTSRCVKETNEIARQERGCGKDSLMVERKDSGVNKSQERITEQVDGNVFAIATVTSLVDGEAPDQEADERGSGKAVMGMRRKTTYVARKCGQEQERVARQPKSTPYDPGGSDGKDAVMEGVEIWRKKLGNWEERCADSVGETTEVVELAEDDQEYQEWSCRISRSRG